MLEKLLRSAAGYPLVRIVRVVWGVEESPSNIDKVNGVNGCGAHASFISPGVCLFVCLFVRT